MNNKAGLFFAVALLLGVAAGTLVWSGRQDKALLPSAAKPTFSSQAARPAPAVPTPLPRQEPPQSERAIIFQTEEMFTPSTYARIVQRPSEQTLEDGGMRACLRQSVECMGSFEPDDYAVDPTGSTTVFQPRTCTNYMDHSEESDTTTLWFVYRTDGRLDMVPSMPNIPGAATDPRITRILWLPDCTDRPIQRPGQQL